MYELSIRCVNCTQHAKTYSRADAMLDWLAPFKGGTVLISRVLISWWNMQCDVPAVGPLSVFGVLLTQAAAYAKLNWVLD